NILVVLLQYILLLSLLMEACSNALRWQPHHWTTRQQAGVVPCSSLPSLENNKHRGRYPHLMGKDLSTERTRTDVVHQVRPHLTHVSPGHHVGLSSKHTTFLLLHALFCMLCSSLLR
ncbi:hypothetical protein L9F63_012918, partial [Diploptera punctata]